MDSNLTTVTLSRDVDAVVVPIGNPVTLQRGEEATITQSLGGSFTVIVGGNMYRIEGVNADALGLETEVETVKPQPTGDGGEVTETDLMDCVWTQMKLVYDPEIPVNIVDLGLVYDCQIAPAEEGRGRKAQVKMTLTAPGCGMGDHLCHDVRMKILQIEGIDEADVELVWEPQWDKSMMTDEARLTLGIM
jgi:probable FeS assembly SUF system protein SufT